MYKIYHYISAQGNYGALLHDGNLFCRVLSAHYDREKEREEEEEGGGLPRPVYHLVFAVHDLVSVA
jgi:hypothetical protein